MKEPLLHEDFGVAGLDARLGWFNPPNRWRLGARGPGLVVEPDGQTDFWQRTHYGFSVDNGHFLGMELRSDFVLSTEVRLHPDHQYDQAGSLLKQAGGESGCVIPFDHTTYPAHRLSALRARRSYPAILKRPSACKRIDNNASAQRAVTVGTLPPRRRSGLIRRDGAHAGGLDPKCERAKAHLSRKIRDLRLPVADAPPPHD